MDDSRISQLNIAQTLSGDEYVPISQRTGITGTIRTVRTSSGDITNYVLQHVFPAGMIMSYAGSVSSLEQPSGWLLCDGRSVIRSAYSKLYAAIGTTYGSNDASTFNLPDLRGRAIIGYCSVATSSNFSSIAGANWPSGTTVSVGSKGGEFYHKLTTSEIPLHTHTVSESGHRHTYAGDDMHPVGASTLARFDIIPATGNIGYDAKSNGGATNLWQTSKSTAGIDISVTGGDMYHNNTQPFIALNYIIKY